MKKTINKIITLAILAPTAVFAQPQGPVLGKTGTLISRVGELVKLALPIVGGLALLAFLWGLTKYIFKADDEGARQEGKNIMIWGIVALFVMVTIWAIIRFLQTELALTNTGPIQFPYQQ